MDIPTVKRFSMGPFGFFGLGGGGGGGWLAGADAVVVVAGLELCPELEAQPQTPANTTVETRMLIADAFFIVLNDFLFGLPCGATLNVSVAYHQKKSRTYETFSLPAAQI
jgi:hypothetical protein